MEGIEFVKHYRAHLTPIVHVSASADGAHFATIAEDGTAKIFDVGNFGAFGQLPTSHRLDNRIRYDQHHTIELPAQSLLLGASPRGSIVVVSRVG